MFFVLFFDWFFDFHVMSTIWGLCFALRLGNCIHYTLVFANGVGDQISIPGWVKPKTQEMALNASFLNTQHYKVWIKGQVEESRERNGLGDNINGGVFHILQSFNTLPPESLVSYLEPPFWEVYYFSADTVSILWDLTIRWFFSGFFVLFGNKIIWTYHTLTKSCICFVYFWYSETVFGIIWTSNLVYVADRL